MKLRVWEKILTWALVLVLPFAKAQTVHQVTWQFDPPPVLDVTVGDIIQFTWVTFLDIWVYPSLNCDDITGRFQIAELSAGGTASYTVQDFDAAPGGKDLFFACAISDGIYCRNGVNALFRVFPITATPTASPTMVSQFTLPPTTAFPTVTPVTVIATNSPTTASPTVAPVIVTSTPTITASTSPSSGPTSSPTNVPTESPTPATPSPTGEVQAFLLRDLEMTIFGISTWSTSDEDEWESVTELYEESFFSDSKNPVGVTDFETSITITDSLRVRRRRLQEGGGGRDEEESLVLTYTQELSYRLAGSDFTPFKVASLPFESSERRDEYVTLYLNSVGGGSALADVTGISAVDGGEIVETEAPSRTPIDQPPAPTTEQGSKSKATNERAMSVGMVIGIVAALLVLCLVFCLLLSCRPDDPDDDPDEDEDNPYIPPSPDIFTANNHSVEHAYF